MRKKGQYQVIMPAVGLALIVSIIILGVVIYHNSHGEKTQVTCSNLQCVKVAVSGEKHFVYYASGSFTSEKGVTYSYSFTAKGTRDWPIIPYDYTISNLTITAISFESSGLTNTPLKQASPQQLKQIEFVNTLTCSDAPGLGGTGINQLDQFVPSIISHMEIGNERVFDFDCETFSQCTPFESNVLRQCPPETKTLQTYGAFSNLYPK